MLDVSQLCIIYIIYMYVGMRYISIDLSIYLLIYLSVCVCVCVCVCVIDRQGRCAGRVPDVYYIHNVYMYIYICTCVCARVFINVLNNIEITCIYRCVR